MIADDNDELRTILEKELREAGYDVTSAGNGSEALEILRTKKFDLLVLDIEMAGIDGFQLLTVFEREVSAYKSYYAYRICRSPS